ncbi:MAG: glycosyltransferase family 4 protein [Acidobacteria bacterium]|nr:glycosyltransferase family 4 protein [Acidobacteriota bacterium]
MRIGVDATVWANRRGYGRHARALLAAALEIDSRNHYVFFVDSEQVAEDLPPAGDVIRVTASAPAAEAARSDGRRRLADLWSMSRALSRQDLDCLLFPTVYSYVPVLSRAYKIVFLHDVIPELFPGHVFPTIAGRLNWKLKSLLARRQADLILTVSEFSRETILQHFHLPPNRVKVVGEAADPVFCVLKNPVLSEALRRQGLEPTQRLLIFVGGFSPHKNLPGLLDAFAALTPRFDDARLVLVGDYRSDPFHSCYREIQERAAKPPLEGRVILAGYLPDEDLAGLLNLGTALVLPSFMEGYGLPAIEAAACGLPVVATNSSPLPQLLGEGGLYIDPYDPAAFEEVLERVLTEPALRCRMREHGIRATAALSWKRAAAELLAVFDQVAQLHAQAA